MADGAESMRLAGAPPVFQGARHVARRQTVGRGSARAGCDGAVGRQHAAGVAFSRDARVFKRNSATVLAIEKVLAIAAARSRRCAGHFRHAVGRRRPISARVRSSMRGARGRRGHRIGIGVGIAPGSTLRADRARGRCRARPAQSPADRRRRQRRCPRRCRLDQRGCGASRSRRHRPQPWWKRKRRNSPSGAAGVGSRRKPAKPCPPPRRGLRQQRTAHSAARGLRPA